VKQHDKMVGYVADLVPGKGNGLITLLHGPPGKSRAVMKKTGAQTKVS
jgi:hypothetical protein